MAINRDRAGKKQGGRHPGRIAVLDVIIRGGNDRRRDGIEAAAPGKICAIVAQATALIDSGRFEIEVINPDMGFHLLPGMYGSWKGQIHGSFKGENFLDGECAEDVNNPQKTAKN